ncbi:MAG TPA: DNA polymerase III subunit alpha, partial [Stellaceae bacterium]|nr:DNA polymerase III subunit alpha [Stellaceae bacterium]
SRQLLEAGQKLLVTTDVRAEEETLRLTAQRIEALDSMVAHAAAGLKVFLGEIEALAPLRNLVLRESGGRGRVSVVVRVPPAREVEIALPGAFKISPSVRAAVKSLPGILDVHDI